MWKTIRTYEAHGIVIDRYVGSTGGVDWVIRDAEGNRLALHREAAPATR